MNEGWICPRCGRVNAPFTPYCDCTETVSNLGECKHLWKLDGCGVSDTKTHCSYICTKCGKRKSETIYHEK